MSQSTAIDGEDLWRLGGFMISGNGVVVVGRGVMGVYSHCKSTRIVLIIGSQRRVTVHRSKKHLHSIENK